MQAKKWTGEWLANREIPMQSTKVSRAVVVSSSREQTKKLGQALLLIVFSVHAPRPSSS